MELLREDLILAGRERGRRTPGRSDSRSNMLDHSLVFLANRISFAVDDERFGSVDGASCTRLPIGSGGGAAWR